jgi:hypothetical protein
MLSYSNSGSSSVSGLMTLNKSKSLRALLLTHLTFREVRQIETYKDLQTRFGVHVSRLFFTFH